MMFAWPGDGDTAPEQGGAVGQRGSAHLSDAGVEARHVNPGRHWKPLWPLGCVMDRYPVGTATLQSLKTVVQRGYLGW